MIIRESPVSKRSNADTSWPPRSPHEALLSSPNGLKRLRETRREELSPTPIKRRRHDVEYLEDESDAEEEDEDEETLQLQLKAIQARLKLKKLQKAKSKAGGVPDENSRARNTSPEIKSHSVVEVPHSPKPQRATAEAPESPRRMLLGIDKGLRASDVSLKRPRAGASTSRSAADHRLEGPVLKPKSFNEKLADARSQDRQRQEKEDRGRQRRSKGFGVTNISGKVGEQVSGQRETRSLPRAGPTRTGNATASIKQNVTVNARPGGQGTADERASGTNGASEEPDILHTDILESHSGIQLSKRLLDESTLTEALSEKTILTIPKLLKHVTAPDYDPPDMETDYVVFGIIASKSLPRTHAATHHTSNNGDPDSARSKFMVVRLTDLKWELDLFLFDTGFERFWKLTVGTVVAILNPAIMPPKPNMRDTGKFSLKLSSSEDTVLEVGMARDLGFCGSLKRDGKECGQWVNKKKTEFCDFHINLAIEKTTSGRMEINGMVGMGLFGGGIGGGRGGGGGGGGGWAGRGRGGRMSKRSHQGLIPEGEYYDRSIHETAYMIPPEFSSGLSAATLLDANDYTQGGMSAKERSRKRLAEHEKERELAKKLSQAGGGLGGEYMRLRGESGGVRPGERDDVVDRESKDARALGLVGSNSAGDVTLSPVKGRRTSGKGTGKQPMGWSGAFKYGLLGEGKKAAKHGTAEEAVERKTAMAAAVTKKAVPSKATKVAPVDDDDDDLDII